MSKSRKAFYLALAATVATPAVVSFVGAQETLDLVNEDDLVWLDNGNETVTITAYAGVEKADLEFPQMLDNKQVIGINPQGKQNGFTTGDLIGIVKLPEGLVYVADESFRGNQIHDLRLPTTIKSIGRNAFAQNRIMTLTLPREVDSVEEGAFMGNPLTEILIENEELYLEESMFDLSLTPTIRGYEGSTAELFALENGLPFIMEQEDNDETGDETGDETDNETNDEAGDETGDETGVTTGDTITPTDGQNDEITDNDNTGDTDGNNDEEDDTDNNNNNNKEEDDTNNNNEEDDDDKNNEEDDDENLNKNNEDDDENLNKIMEELELSQGSDYISNMTGPAGVTIKAENGQHAISLSENYKGERLSLTVHTEAKTSIEKANIRFKINPFIRKAQVIKVSDTETRLELEFRENTTGKVITGNIPVIVKRDGETTVEKIKYEIPAFNTKNNQIQQELDKLGKYSETMDNSKWKDYFTKLTTEQVNSLTESQRKMYAEQMWNTASELKTKQEISKERKELSTLMLEYHSLATPKAKREELHKEIVAKLNKVHKVIPKDNILREGIIQLGRLDSNGVPLTESSLFSRIKSHTAHKNTTNKQMYVDKGDGVVYFDEVGNLKVIKGGVIHLIAEHNSPKLKESITKYKK